MTEPPSTTDFFASSLAQSDPEVFEAIRAELSRQQDQIELIASENIVSTATLEALGSVMTNKTVEGYPGQRYYGGVEYADRVERLAIERACELFGCAFANVQPHSGSQANQAVYLAFLSPHDTVLSMALAAGGHLSHGAAPNLSGKWLSPIQYGVRAEDGLIDYEEVAALAHSHRPKMIVAGGSAYPRSLDFARFREIADAVDALLLVDMAHFAGLVAGGQHPSPVGHAHVITATTYKNLRGVRGGVILSDDPHIAKRIDSAVFPGIQGSSLLNAIAAKAVCFREALQPEFADYARRVLANAKALANALTNADIDLVTGGTDTPLMLADLRRLDLTGADASDCLERAGLTCNKNAVPGDTKPPRTTSGLRFGVSAGTTRGFDEAEFRQIGIMIGEVLQAMARRSDELETTIEHTRARVSALCQDFPIY